MALTREQLTGRADGHIEFDEAGVGLTPSCRAAFLRLRADAAEAGFDPRIASAFRGFEHQLAIWNGKASGERAVRDDAGTIVPVAELDEEARVHAILRFSALPGASRHHWGCDLDIYDAAALPAGYRLRLVAAEVADDGMFGPLHRWLDERVDGGGAHGFFRPYDRDRGGVAPERWHLSYAPESGANAVAHTEDMLREALCGADLALSGTVLDLLPELYRRYVPVPL